MLWPALESSCAGLHDTEGNLDWPGEWPHDTAAALQVFQDSIDAHLGERLVSLEDELKATQRTTNPDPEATQRTTNLGTLHVLSVAIPAFVGHDGPWARRFFCRRLLLGRRLLSWGSRCWRRIHRCSDLLGFPCSSRVVRPLQQLQQPPLQQAIEISDVEEEAEAIWRKFFEFVQQQAIEIPFLVGHSYRFFVLGHEGQFSRRCNPAPLHCPRHRPRRLPTH